MLIKILLLGFIHETVASHTNFQVKRFEVCNNTQGQIKFYGHVTKEQGNQYLSFNMTSPVPWDDNLGFSFLIQTKVVEDVFMELFTIREKNSCKALNKYLGEFWYDIERAAQIFPVGACPVRAGKYHAHRLLLNCDKFALQTFPYGRLRFIIKAIDNKNINVNMFCIFMEVENTIN